MRIIELFVNRKAANRNKCLAFNLTVIISIAVLTCLTAIVGSAQQIPNRGAKVGNSYAVGDFETVNTTNGNLMLNFPLGSLPAGRGEVGAGVNLIYNSKLYDTKVEKIRDWRYPNCSWEIEGPENCRYFEKTVMLQSDKGGWKYGMAYSLEFEDRRTKFGQNQPTCYAPNHGMTAYWEEMTYIHKLRVVFPDGSTHEMIPAGHPDLRGDGFYRVRMDGGIESCGFGTSPGPRPVYYSIDGTYARLESTSAGNWTLYFSDGRKVVNTAGQPQRVYDRNGNYVDIHGNQVTDQLGRSVTISTNAQGESEIRSKGVGGEELVWKVKWKSIGVAKTYKACIGNENDCPPEDQRSRLAEVMTVVDKITMPQQLGGQSYTFSYNAPATMPASPQTSTGWGEVSGVQLPTGAQISYGYEMDGLDGSEQPDSIKEILRNHPRSKTLTYNRDYDGASTPTTENWYYSTASNSGGGGGPDGIGTTNYFGNTDEEYQGSGLTYKSVKSDGTMTENLWAFNCPSQCLANNSGPGINPYVKTEFASIKDSVGNYSLTAIKDYTYDKNGNVTQVKEYDWMPYGNVPRDQYGQITGIPTGVSPKRITATGYYAETPEASVTTTDHDSYIWASATTPTKLKNIPAWTEIRSGNGTPVSRAEMNYDDASTTGNLTGTKAWDSTKGAYSNPLTSGNFISTAAEYNQYGMPTLTTDAKGNQTQFTYGDIIGGPNGAVTNLYPTQIISAYGSPVSQTAQTEYDFYTGLPKKVTALGNKTAEDVSSETVYDPAGRPIRSKAAVGIVGKEVWTQIDYNDQARRVITKSDLFAKGDGKKVSIQHFDQIGRVRLSRTLENPATEDPTNEQHGIKVQTRYFTGNPNSYQLTSNPYRAATSGAATSEPSMGWTQSKSVNTGKLAETETFSGAGLPVAFGGSNTSSTGAVKTNIDLDRVLVTDQAGKQRISRTNALGQMTDVWEITPSDASAVTVGFAEQSSTGYQTSYQYDTLNNLTTVNQGSQTRSFSYSSLSRLTAAINPELGTVSTSGTISYAYDDNGNLTQKIDPRGVTTTFDYDALNRVKSRVYAGETGQQTPNVTYTYDDPLVSNSKGRLTKVASTISQTEYTGFDILGRVTAHKQTTDNVGYTTAYDYYLSGALMEQTYPSTRVVKNDLNNANGDLSAVQSKKTSVAGFRNYADTFTYTAAGAVGSMRLGNNNVESTVFNSRFQPTEIGLKNAAGADILKLNYAYSSVLQKGNNGNVIKQTITVPTIDANPAFVATQNYTYDSLNRLKSATETISGNQTWKQTFLYDRYGNRNFDQANTTTLTKNCQSGGAPIVCAGDVPIYDPTIDTAKNRLNGYTYDNAGNTTKDAQSRKFIYDAENKQTKVQTVDANGNVTSTVGEYSYDGDGKRVKKYVPSTGETTIFVYDASGKMVAEYSTTIAPALTAKVSYLTMDNLGSPRITTDANGAVISRRDFMPFGEEIARAGYGTDMVRQKFTGYERDIESDLDYAQARYYNPKHGRFTRPDEPFADQYEDDPQSWNLYVYVVNNPLLFTDSTGLWKQVSCSSGKCWEADQDGDTFTSLAKILGVSVNNVTGFFNDVNPNNIQLGQTFDLGGFDHFLNVQGFASAGIDIQGYAGEGINPNDRKHVQEVPPEMQPNKPSGNYMKDGLPLFGKGIRDGIETFAPLPLPSKILILGKILKASKKIIRQAGGRGWTKK